MSEFEGVNTPKGGNFSPLDNAMFHQLIMKEEKSNLDETKKDVFRDTPVRYLGYANEVGEAFRSFVPRSVVISSYLISSGYVFADAASKGYSASKDIKKVTDEGRKTSPVVSFADALIWQSFASVIIPGITINRLCAASLFGIRRYLSYLPSVAQKGTSTVIGLLAIPLIIHPIDRSVDAAMNSSLRKFYFVKQDDVSS